MSSSPCASAHRTQRRRAARTSGASSALSAPFVSLGSAPALFPSGGRSLVKPGLLSVHASVVLAAGALGALAPATSAQLADLQPGRNFTAEPNFGADFTEELDVGDVDLDGDLDVIAGNGGDSTVPQIERIFINDGLGGFSDETSTRFAGAVADKSRDIEFVDHDADGDLDVFVANHNTGGGSLGAVSRFYVNLGGLQSGGTGYFQEDTDDRWGQLVSVPLGDQVYGGNFGPFRAWSGDADFADLDDDGDVDLFFTAYGPAIDGSRPSRLFLNDGAGLFHELWPWANPGADVSWHTIDTDLADFDGDFDLDVFASSRNSQARVFVNNLYGPLSASPFNDITATALLATSSGQTGSANYEVEFGDLDGDADFDVWLVNYSNNLDRILKNDGVVTGGFQFTRADTWLKNDPNHDESEADFGDYDNDGDLDVFLANFSGTNFLYQSGLAQGLNPHSQGLLHRTGVGIGLAPAPELPSNFNGGTSLDGEWADLDGDGDLDILLANDKNQGSWLFRNVLGVPDTHAPLVLQLTAQADKPNGTDTVIHARVQDNAPFYLHDFYAAELVYSVDGGAAQSVAMFAQGGQQYRGVIPAQTDATIEYHIEVTDLAGNTGVSARTSFVQGTMPIDPWTDLGSGLAGVAGLPSLVGSGPLTAGSAGALTLTNAAPSAICALFVSISSTPAPFKCGTLVPVPVAIQLTLVTNGAGALPLAWGSWPSGLSGASLYFQYAIADGAAVCGTSLSNAVRGDVP